MRFIFQREVNEYKITTIYSVSCHHHHFSKYFFGKIVKKLLLITTMSHQSKKIGDYVIYLKNTDNLKKQQKTATQTQKKIFFCINIL